MLCMMVMAMGVMAQAKWQPRRPINLIVPWGPGGASDLTARIVAAEMEKPLGQRIIITNTPGGSGAIGTKEMFDLPHDGYTWSGNANGSIVTYQVLEFLDISHRDYANFFAMFTPNVICVPANSPYQDLPALIQAMKTGRVTVSSAGTGSGGHQAAEFFKKYAGVDYVHVPYQGGVYAVTATVSGEVDCVMQLSMEVVEMLRAKQLKALAVMDNKPLEVEGVGAIPPITNWIADFPSVGSYFGLFLPKDIRGRPGGHHCGFRGGLQQRHGEENFATEGSVAVCIYGERGRGHQRAGSLLICWMLYDGGFANIEPSQFGIRGRNVNAARPYADAPISIGGNLIC